MPPDIPSSMNTIIINQLALNLVDIFLDSTPQMLCKSLLCLAQIRKIDYSEMPKFGKILNVQLQNSISRSVVIGFQ